MGEMHIAEEKKSQVKIKPPNPPPSPVPNQNLGNEARRQH